MKHLSYRQFKNIFGDWGVTAWVKFNWLSNGLPDGTYNGITKVTLDGTGFSYHSSGVIYKYFPFVAAVNNDSPYPFGFASVPIVGANQERTIEGLHVAFHTNGNIDVCFSNKTSRSEIEGALKKNPITLYFYNRNEWRGFTLTAQNTAMGGAGQFFATLGRNKEVRDVLGDYENIEPQANWNFGDKQICTNSSNDFVMIKDSRFTSKDDFASAMLPRAIVYKDI